MSVAHRILASLLTALVLTAALPARLAQAQTPAQKKEGRALAKEGNTAYRLGRFEEALDLYERAYKRFPEPRLLYNLAQCHRMLGHTEKPVFLYRNFLEHFPDAPNKAFVERTIGELEQKRAEEQRRAEEARKAEEKRREEERLAIERAKAQAAPAVLPLPRPTPVEVTATVPAGPVSPPWYKRWYVWTPIAVVLAGGGATAAVLLTRHPQNPTAPMTPSGNMNFFGAK